MHYINNINTLKQLSILKQQYTTDKYDPVGVKPA